jgi:cell division protein FtsZ
MRREKRLLTLARIRIVGVGGGGGNAINHMIAQGIYGVDFIAINTDGLTLSKSQAPTRICIGKNVTRYLGSGGCPMRGEQAALESIDKIQAALEGSDMLFITAGLGGGTGTGAAPVIARVAQELGIFTIAIVTRPFCFEGSRQVQVAEAGLAKLSSQVDTLIVIPNDRLLEVVGERTSLNDAFHMVNDVLYQGVQGISELITVPGLINLDFADVKTIMARQGPTLIGVGIASGDDRGRRAAKQATRSPLLNMTIDGARSLLVNVIAGTGLYLREIEQVTDIIKEAVHPDANIIFGTTLDDRLGAALRVTVVATGLEQFEFFGEPSDMAGHRTYPWQQLEPPAAFPPPLPQPAESVESDYSLHNYMVPAYL